MQNQLKIQVTATRLRPFKHLKYSNRQTGSHFPNPFPPAQTQSTHLLLPLVLQHQVDLVDLLRALAYRVRQHRPLGILLREHAPEQRQLKHVDEVLNRGCIGHRRGAGECVRTEAIKGQWRAEAHLEGGVAEEASLGEEDEPRVVRVAGQGVLVVDERQERGVDLGAVGVEDSGAGLEGLFNGEQVFGVVQAKVDP